MFAGYDLCHVFHAVLGFQAVQAEFAFKPSQAPKPKKPDAGPQPERPVEDDLLRLGDRAQTFAEIAEEQEREGDPDGVEWGTETDAQLGDIYRGKLVAFFKRGWTIPTTLGDTSSLIAVAEVELTRASKVGPSRILKPSGDPLFDQSVEVASTA